MTLAHVTPRRGLSLTEVLVAIFVMGLGMLSLLVLYPVGLSNMKWALQDNHLALASQTAIANAEAMQMFGTQRFNLRSDPNYYLASEFIPDGMPTVNGLLSWHPAPLGGYPNNPQQPAYDPAGPRPPVFVDSIGVCAYSSGLAGTPDSGGFPFLTAPPGRWGYGIGVRKVCASDHDRLHQPALGGVSRENMLFGIPRIRSAHITGLDDALRACVQEDEVTFGQNAQPSLNAAGQVERENRYSWAYMCRFPRGSDPSVVDMTIVLYSGRKLTGVVGTLDTQRTSGERRYFGNPATSNAGFLPPPPAGVAGPLAPVGGLVFVKGSNEAIINLHNPDDPWYANGGNTNLPPNAAVASKFKKGDIVLDNTLVMPEFTGYAGPALPPRRYYGPFDSQITTTRTAPAPLDSLGNPPTLPFVRKGLANGYFYKVLHVGPVEQHPVNFQFMQRLILDRPALADGFEAVHLEGAIDIIEKSNGHLPAR